MIGKPTEVKSLWFLWLVMIGLSVYTINQFIWEVFGKVQVSFSEHRVEFKNMNSLIKKESSIIYDNIKSISFSEEDYNPLFMWGASPPGNVKIKYSISEKRIGRGLNKNECLHLVRILRTEIRKRSK